MKIRNLTIALSLLAIAPAAFAQETNADDKRFAIVGGYAVQKNDSRPIDNSSLSVDGGSAATLSASWYATPQFAVELWGAADKFEQRVRTDEAGKLGNIDSQPVALSAQYHFGQSNATIRPFVGLGYYENNYSGGNNIRVADQHVGLETAKGAMGTVGVDFNISPSWFARADARYLHGGSDLTLNGTSTNEEAKMNPWIVGFGVGARF